MHELLARIGPSHRLPRVLLIGYLLSAAMPTAVAWAHADGHDALPSTGAKILGDKLLLSPTARGSLGLTLAKVELRDLDYTIGANANVLVPWHQQAIVTSLVGGKIDRILVRPGERVAAGQELVHIASVELETLQLDMLRGVAESDLATHMLTQRERMAKANSIAERRVLESRSSVQQRRAELAIVERKLRALGLSEATLAEVRKTGKPVHTIPLRTPIAGIISAADVRTGEFITPTQHLYHVVDLSQVWVHGDVLETDSHDVAEGMPVTMTFPALADQTFTGKIHHVDLKVDIRRRILPVTVEMKNPQHLLRPGMFGRMHILARQVHEAIACPAAAILRGAEGPYVLVQDLGNTFLRRPVKLGLRTSEFVEVIDGVFPGDRVVTTGGVELAALFTQEDVHDAGQEGVAPVVRAPTPDRIVRTSTKPPGAAKSVVVQATIELPTLRKSFASASAAAPASSPTPSAAGRVLRILVEHGQRVEAGDVLAEIQSLELRNLQLDLLLACTRLSLAERSLERFQQLDIDGAVAERDLWQARTERDNLLTTVASLEDKLALLGFTKQAIDKLAQLDLGRQVDLDKITGVLPVRAPAGGWIVDFELIPGQIVEPNDQLFEIDDLSTIDVQGFVFEQDAAKIRVGQRVTVTLSSNPDYIGTSRLARSSPVLTTNDRVLSVWAELPNPNQQLKEGMLATMTIHVGEPESPPRAESGTTISKSE